MGHYESILGPPPRCDSPLAVDLCVTAPYIDWMSSPHSPASAAPWRSDPPCTDRPVLALQWSGTTPTQRKSFVSPANTCPLYRRDPSGTYKPLWLYGSDQPDRFFQNIPLRFTLPLCAYPTAPPEDGWCVFPDGQTAMRWTRVPGAAKASFPVAAYGFESPIPVPLCWRMLRFGLLFRPGYTVFRRRFPTPGTAAAVSAWGGSPSS